MTESAEQAVVARSPIGVSEHDMPGGWRVIVARVGELARRTWYFHSNDDARHQEALRRQAREWTDA